MVGCGMGGLPLGLGIWFQFGQVSQAMHDTGFLSLSLV